MSQNPNMTETPFSPYIDMDYTVKRLKVIEERFKKAFDDDTSPLWDARSGSVGVPPDIMFKLLDIVKEDHPFLFKSALLWASHWDASNPDVYAGDEE